MPLDTYKRELFFPVVENQPLISCYVCIQLVFVVCSAQVIFVLCKKQRLF